MEKISPEQGVGSRIGQTFSLFFSENFKLLFGIPLLMQIGILLLSFLGVSGGFLLLSGMVGSFSVTSIIFIIVFVVAAFCLGLANLILLFHILSGIFSGKKISCGELTNHLFSKFLSFLKRIFVVLVYGYKYPLLLGLVSLVGLLFAGVTGEASLLKLFGLLGGAAYIWFVILSLRLFPAFALIVDKDYDGKKSVEESKKITAGNWWRSLGNFLLFGILIGATGAVIGGVGATLGEFVSQIVSLVFGALSSGLFTTFIFLFYKRLELEAKGN